MQLTPSNVDDRKPLPQFSQQVFRLKTMIDDMLQQMQLDLVPIDPNALIQQLATAFKQVAQQKQQQLTFQPCEESVLLLVDQPRLKVALSNLIDNALRYTPESGSIIVSCRHQYVSFTIEVVDNGPGIPPDDLPHIFERFYRVEAHRPQNAGAGLGLSMAKRIIELHGGTIQAQNRPTRGMCVQVYLPTAKPVPPMIRTARIDSFDQRE